MVIQYGQVFQTQDLLWLVLDFCDCLELVAHSGVSRGHRRSTRHYCQQRFGTTNLIHFACPVCCRFMAFSKQRDPSRTLIEILYNNRYVPFYRFLVRYNQVLCDECEHTPDLLRLDPEVYPQNSLILIERQTPLQQLYFRHIGPRQYVLIVMLSKCILIQKDADDVHKYSYVAFRYTTN